MVPAILETHAQRFLAEPLAAICFLADADADTGCAMRMARTASIIMTTGDLGGDRLRQIAITEGMDVNGKQQQADSAEGNLIVESFELAAERCEDLTPVVYERLFREYPETRALFRTEGSNLVKGSMLQLAVEALIDFAGERKGAHRMIYCEVVSHEAYGTRPEIFGVFFPVIADCLRELLADKWSPMMEAAWVTLLADIDVYVKDALRAVYGETAQA